MSNQNIAARACAALERKRELPAIRAINAFMASPYGIGALAALTLLANLLSLELVLYTVTVLYGIYLCLLGDDLLTLSPFFVFCYIAPSRANNPGRTDESIFSGAGGVFLLIAAGLLLLALAWRLSTDKRFGIKRLLTQKRQMLWGMLLLGLAYVLSGMGSAHYGEIWAKNIGFALVQFACLFVPYLLFTALVDWEKARRDYFAWIGFFAGCVIALEIVNIYLAFNGDFISGGSINDRWSIYLGWGMHNNIGAMLATTMPFAFYLACQYKRGYLFMLPAVGMMAALCLTVSRASILAGSLAFAASAALMILYSKNRRVNAVVGLSLFAAAGVMVLIFREQLSNTFSILFEHGLLNDSGRFELYKNGLNVFYGDPILGEGFYPADMSIFKNAYWFAGYEITDFLPPRWHNTVIQLLASCGILGLLGYGYHRVQSLWVFFKGLNVPKLFLGVSVAAFLGMSLLDCHFFNLGPTLFYSLALTFAECGCPSKKSCEVTLAKEPS